MCLYLSLNEITHGYVMDMAQLRYSGASIIYSPIGLAFILSNTSILLDNVQYSYQTPFIFMHTDVRIHTHASVFRFTMFKVRMLEFQMKYFGFRCFFLVLLQTCGACP